MDGFCVGEGEGWEGAGIVAWGEGGLAGYVAKVGGVIW